MFVLEITVLYIFFVLYSFIYKLDNIAELADSEKKFNNKYGHAT